MTKANLTEEQKQANKQALAERRQAYNARRKAYDAEMAAAKGVAERLPEYAAEQDTSTDFETAVKRRDEAIRAVDAEIEKLEAQRKELQSQHQLAVNDAKALQRAAWSAHGVALRKLQQEVKDRYPDMADCWNLHDWILRTSPSSPPEAQLRDGSPLKNHGSVIHTSQ